MEAKKILIIRFSSIGDIVLTSPIIRCLKKQLPNAQIHYLTKENYKNILSSNPYITKIHTLKHSIADTAKELKSENFDFVVDLHHNLRSLLVKTKLNIPSQTFNKLNVRKWIYVKTKRKSIMPSIHIVDRYFEAVSKLGVTNDMAGLDFFDGQISNIDLPFDNYVAIVCGATHTTKQIPPKYIEYLCQNIKQNIILLGDSNDAKRLQTIAISNLPNVVNMCGKCSLYQSALYVKHSSLVITSDTGLMHIAAAYNKNIITIWGNTTPQLGMYPYMPTGKGKYINIEAKDVKCRPCSKIGYKECPKKHFLCMNKIVWDDVVQAAEKIIAQ
ncbi:MAG: glycosyltransferase family 9 protein [Bacteroidales bacterium]|nr:glycosyltransferase family 9 protein [Bacteroidales bacterium]